MNNHVFYKTTVPNHLRHVALVGYLEKRQAEIADHLQFLEREMENYLFHGFRGSYKEIYCRFGHFELPMVILCDKSERVTYGALTIRELSEELIRLRQKAMNSRVSNAIDGILPILKEAANRHLTEDEKEKINIILLEILGSIDQKKLPGQEADEVRELLALLGDLQYTCTVYGEYIAKLNLIVLYYNSILIDANKHGHSADSLFTMVLAHEMFHAFHCQTVGENRFAYTGGRTRKLKTQNRQLTEALADFYAVYYLITLYDQNKQRIFHEEADHRYAAWKKNQFGAWPYSRALYFFTPDPFRPGHTRRLNTLSDHLPENPPEYNSFFEKFMKVFLTVAKNDRKEAYRILLEE